MICASTFGYLVLKNEKHFPKELGGNGDPWLTYDNYPYPVHAPYLKEYFLIVCGYHFGQLCYHMIENK